MNRFKVSTVIAIYNGEKTLKRAIGSVISQTIFDCVELILIDDGSKDKSKNIARKFAEKYSKNIFFFENGRNLGIAKTQNRALKLSHGKYIARLDQDDLWIDSQKLAKQLKMFETNPRLGLVGTWAKVVNKKGPNFELIPPLSDQRIRSKLLLADMFVTPSLMFKKSVVKKIGNYREDLIYGTEDFEFWLRIGKVSELANLGEYCLRYYFHPGSYSNQRKIEAIGEHLKIIKSYAKDYPHYRRAFLKNWIQYNLLKIKFLRGLYNYLVPRLAGKIYS